MNNVFTKEGGSGFADTFDQLMAKVADQTTLGEEGNQSPLVVLLISDGTIGDDGRRVVNAYAGFDMPLQEGIDRIQEVIAETTGIDA